jgi:Bacterial protein of unknown function (DUF853)
MIDEPNGGFVDPETGEVHGASSNCPVFAIPASKFKREYLELPEGLVQVLGSTSQKEPLDAFDSVSRRHIIVDYYADRKLLGGLGEWFREHRPQPSDQILITVLDGNKRKIEIRKENEEEMSGMTGLFLGKEYSIVGGRRFESNRDFYLPVNDFLTHSFICGITGSGKTVVGKAIVEEMAKRGIPSIIVDLKGDLSSLALTLTEAKEFEPWIEARTDGERKARADKEKDAHFRRLDAFGLGPSDVKSFKSSVVFRVFTPRSSKGIPLSFASPLGAPPYPMEMHETDPESFNNLVASLVNAFLDRLYPGTKRAKIENERSFVYELVHHAWVHGINLHGENGLRELLMLVENPPFNEIGGLPVPQYIDSENRRHRLLNKINTMLTGAERMWFEGKQLNMKLFLDCPAGKTPINIINVAELDHFEDRSFVVAQVAYEINKWMRTLAGTQEPRLLFFIDEIGGGGGRQALFPSFPYESAAKWGLNYLVRQGRAVGICCLFATQNPGDVDYKALSNCQTWIIGKLATDRDRKKVLEGMEVWGAEAERVKQNLTGAQTGDFVAKTKHGEIRYFKERWLMSYHRVLTMAEIARVSKQTE